MVRNTLKTDSINRLVDVCFKKYPNGLVTNVQKGKVPSQYQSLASYVAKYVVSPPISVRRIDRSAGRYVQGGCPPTGNQQRVTRIRG